MSGSAPVVAVSLVLPAVVAGPSVALALALALVVALELLPVVGAGLALEPPVDALAAALAPVGALALVVEPSLALAPASSPAQVLALETIVRLKRQVAHARRAIGAMYQLARAHAPESSLSARAGSSSRAAELMQ